jgi:hypothetical protein
VLRLLRHLSSLRSRLAVSHGGHFLDDCGEFLSLPREYFELPLCIIVGEREEFHRRFHARQFCRLLDRGVDVGISEFENLCAVVLSALEGRRRAVFQKIGYLAGGGAHLFQIFFRLCRALFRDITKNVWRTVAVLA